MRVTAVLRDRGNAPRGMARAYGHAARRAWLATATRFHQEYRERRFTEAHAKEAGYAARKGELMPRGTRAFWRSYTGVKLRRFGHTHPLWFTGKTHEQMRFASVTSTRNMGRVAYRGASKFSLRHPKSRIRMSDEFRRILPREAEELGTFFDHRLDVELAMLDRS